MEIQKKNLIYKALAVTFAVMFFSLLFAQAAYKHKVSKFEMEMSYIRDTLKEGQIILSLRNVVGADKAKAEDPLTDGMAKRLYETGIAIERLANDDDSRDFFAKVSREWIYLNVELWQRLRVHNRISAKKKSWLIYIYPVDCAQCVSYTNLFGRLHREYGEKLWFFILPDNSESGVLQVLKHNYDVKGGGPAVIVNGKLASGDEPLKIVEGRLSDALKAKDTAKAAE